MSKSETPEEHAARMKAAMELADSIIAATKTTTTSGDATTTVDGTRYGQTGGTVHGTQHYRF